MPQHVERRPAEGVWSILRSFMPLEGIFNHRESAFEKFPYGEDASSKITSHLKELAQQGLSR